VYSICSVSIIWSNPCKSNAPKTIITLLFVYHHLICCFILLHSIHIYINNTSVLLQKPCTVSKYNKLHNLGKVDNNVFIILCGERLYIQVNSPQKYMLCIKIDLQITITLEFCLLGYNSM
jgi:hypothetical protein